MSFIPESQRQGWRIVGKGTDNDSTFSITEGHLSPNGNAYWEEDHKHSHLVTTNVTYDFEAKTWSGTWFCSNGISGHYTNFHLDCPSRLDPYTYANIDRKSFVTATVYKPAPDAKLGVIFAAKRTYGGYGILLKTIKPGSPFEATSLQTGMEIFAINNTSFHCVAEIGPFLRNAPEGIITIVAKPNASEIDGLYARDALRAIVVNKQVEKVGTTFFQTGANQIVVSKIADHSIFAGTALQVGSKVLSVNNRSGFSKLSDFTTALWTTMGTVTLLVEGPVPETNATATATLVDSEVPTTVDALTPYSEGSRPVASLPTALATPLSSPDFDPNFNMGMHSLVTASVWKPNKDFKLGVRLAANTDGTGTILNGLEPGSPLYATDLRVGMELLAVNNQPCTTPKQVASLLVACQGGHVTVLAKRSGGIPLLAVEGV